MKKTLLLAAAASIAFAGSANAQAPVSPFAVEVRGGVALPQGDFGEGLETGYTIGANATFQFMPMLGVYAGYEYSSFGVEDGDDVNVTDKGFSAGLRASFGGAGLPITPFVKGGVVYHKVGFDADGGNLDLDSELGFEVGGGVEIGMGPNFALTPGVTYSSYSVDLDGEDGDVNNLRVDVGFRLTI